MFLYRNQTRTVLCKMFDHPNMWGEFKANVLFLESHRFLKTEVWVGLGVFFVFAACQQRSIIMAVLGKKGSFLLLMST